jgi:small GTP-binding protein
VAVKHKICLLGASGVGKTSLVRRYVRAVFFEQYRTNVGVVIERKLVRRAGQDVDLVIWDLSGEDEFQHVRTAYVRGASGYLLVIDGTRAATLETARMLRAHVLDVVGPLPSVVALNKVDLIESWEIDRRSLDGIGASAVLQTSAKTGEGVEEAFGDLTSAILAERAAEEIPRGGR